MLAVSVCLNAVCFLWVSCLDGLMQCVCIGLPLQLTHLSAGLGFCVVYAPFRSPRLWLVGTDSSVLPTTGPQCLQLPPTAGDVREVASGMAHGAVLATSGEGASQVVTISN